MEDNPEIQAIIAVAHQQAGTKVKNKVVAANQTGGDLLKQNQMASR